MSETFFRFPLALLALDPQVARRTQSTIVDWCVVDVGNSTFGHLTHEDLVKEAKDQDIDRFRELNPTGSDQLQAFLGAKILNVRYTGSVRHVKENHSDAEDFLSRSSKSSRNNRVNVSSELLWSCFYTLKGTATERTLQWRDYRIICALTSKIGKFGFQKCGWGEIQARAAGWCGKADMESASVQEFKRREPLILTRDKIRTSLDRMEADNSFARYMHASGKRGGESWFSFSCGGDRNKLIEMVSTRKCRRRDKLNGLRAADKIRSTEMQEKQSPPSSPQPIPNINQNGGEIPNINTRTKSVESSPTVPQISPNPVPNSIPNSSPTLTIEQQLTIERPLTKERLLTKEQTLMKTHTQHVREDVDEGVFN